MMHDVAILIVTYNSAGQIATCLRSVRAERESVTQQVIVLDNASTDETAEIVRREFPEVMLVEPGRNLGFAAGVNEAARHANAEYLLLLNPDTEVRAHAVDRVVAFARANPRHGLYGGRTVKPDGTLEPSSCWGAPTLWSLFLYAIGATTFAARHPLLDPESLGGWQRDSVREVGIITGCFLLADRVAWGRLGGFDERYFMYGEDADLAIRARAAGYRPVITPEAVVMHEVGSSSARPIDKMLLLFRGKAELARTRWRGLRQQLAVAFLAAGVALRAGLARLGGGADDRWPQLWRRRDEWIGGYSGVIGAVSAPRVLPSTSPVSG